MRVYMHQTYQCNIQYRNAKNWIIKSTSVSVRKYLQRGYSNRKFFCSKNQLTEESCSKLNIWCIPFSKLRGRQWKVNMFFVFSTETVQPFQNLVFPFECSHWRTQIVTKTLVIKVCSGQVHSYMSRALYREGCGVFIFPRATAITHGTRKRSDPKLTSGCTQCRMRCCPNLRRYSISCLVGSNSSNSLAEVECLLLLHAIFKDLLQDLSFQTCFLAYDADFVR